MQKKIYIAPLVKVIELDMEMIIAASGDEELEIEYTDEEANEEFEVLVNKRRGVWGDLWCEEEQV